MILFFFGDDTFRIREKRLDFRNVFFEKNPNSAGFFEFDFSEGADAASLSLCLSQSGLFAAKKFVIAGNIFDAPIDVRRSLAEFLDAEGERVAIDEQRILLLFQNGQPKKNEKLWKSLVAKHIKTQEFSVLHGEPMFTWMDRHALRFGAPSIELPAKKLLLEICRTEPKRQGEKPIVDMFRLDSEIRKLAAYRDGGAIREEDVRVLSARPAEEGSVFEALDLLFAGRKREAMLLFARLMKSNEALGLLGMCAWQLRNIVRTKGALLEGRIRSAGETAKLLGMHPFAAGKCRDIASRSSMDSLERSFLRLARLDRGAKSGVRDPDEALIDFVMEAR